MPGSNSRPNVSEGYEVPLSYRGDRLRKDIMYDILSIHTTKRKRRHWYKKCSEKATSPIKQKENRERKKRV